MRTSPLGCAGAVAVAVALVACGSSRAPAPPLPPVEGASCVVRGTAAINAGTRIVDERGAGIAQLDGHPARFEVTLESGSSSRSRVRVRSGLEGPGLLVDGFVERDALLFRTAATVDVVPGHVAIAPGSPISVTHWNGRAATVAARDAAFEGPPGSAACSAIEVGEPALPERDQRRPPSAGHVTVRDLPLLAEPGGAAIATLKVLRSPTLEIVERRRDAVRIVYRGGLVLNGWLDAAHVADGEGPDTDDAYRHVPDVSDVCPRDEAACREATASVVRDDAPVGTRPGPGATRTGMFERGTRVLVLQVLGPSARVVVEKGGLAPVEGNALWVAAASLVPP